ncbi:MAG: HesA/MoeB/ThiF family protein [Alphaproteobacteria bacterium]|jgi:molybdopterin/thiamine biosynthesis adenylyltransferase|nr:HesA/MoeB/ThiF family protein [Alphaproteobacteria bacterium]
MLNEQELDRYSRHIKLEGFGEKSQLVLKDSSVLVIGAGGLGSPCLIYLASSGVGNIGIIDFDTVSLSNLQRQTIHGERNIGRLKVDSSLEFLKQLNSDITINTYNGSIVEEKYHNLIEKYDIIALCVDDLATRYVVNELCLKYKKIHVSAAVVGYSGWLTTFNPNIANSPCYECLQPKVEVNIIKKAADIGVFAPLVGILGTWQAAEVIKELLHLGSSSVGILKTISILDGKVVDIKLSKRANCLCCS